MEHKDRDDYDISLMAYSPMWSNRAWRVSYECQSYAVFVVPVSGDCLCSNFQFVSIENFIANSDPNATRWRQSFSKRSCPWPSSSDRCYGQKLLLLFFAERIAAVFILVILFFSNIVCAANNAKNRLRVECVE